MVARALVCGCRLQERSPFTKQIGGKSTQINQLFSGVLRTKVAIESSKKVFFRRNEKQILTLKWFAAEEETNKVEGLRVGLAEC